MRRRGLVIALLTVLGVLGLATPAFAHNVLIGSDPKNGSSLATGPSRITLTFDQPVQPGFNTITVVGANSSHWEDGAATVDGNTVSANVRPLGAAGQYTVGYRIVSADGHPVSGAIRFTLTTAGNGTPGTPAAAQSGSDNGGSGGMSAWPWIVCAVVLLGVGLLLALRSGGRSEAGGR